MHKFKFFLLLGLANILFFGCSSEEEPEVKQEGYFMEAKIDGTEWESQIGGFFGGALLTGGGYPISITGYGTDFDSQLTIVIPFEVSSIEEKSYGINSLFDPGDEIVGYYSPTFFSSGFLGISYSSTTSSGTLTITKFDEQNDLVEGTFEFTAEATDNDNNVIATTSITEGKFSLPIE